MSNSLKIIGGLVIAALVVTAGVHAMTRMKSAAVVPTLATTSANMASSSSIPTQAATVVEAKTDASTSPTAPKAMTIAELALRTNAQWKQILTPAQYSVLREKGTETPFTSDLLHETRKGTFVTADCGEPVFRSEQKFDSGTGWPSFYAPISGSSVIVEKDNSFGMTRDEVETPICHSHLGHLFHDAPQTPTGDRYCINGVALRFIPDTVQ